MLIRSEAINVSRAEIRSQDGDFIIIKMNERETDDSFVCAFDLSKNNQSDRTKERLMASLVSKIEKINDPKLLTYVHLTYNTKNEILYLERVIE